MSNARGSQNGGHHYSNIVIPQELSLSFTVNHTDSGGLGITGLKSNGWVEYLFMRTTATAGVSAGVTNPVGTTAGLVVMRLKSNYNVFLNAQCTPEVTTTGSTVTSPNAGTAYQINSLGTTTLAQWNTAGLPYGFVPTVGQVFVCAATGALGGTGNVKALTVAGFDNFEVIGNPTLTIASNSLANYAGAYLVGQFVLAGALAAPTDGTVINLKLLFDRSSVTVDGL